MWVLLETILQLDSSGKEIIFQLVLALATTMRPLRAATITTDEDELNYMSLKHTRSSMNQQDTFLMQKNSAIQ
jgi:hypothetical protein